MDGDSRQKLLNSGAIQGWESGSLIKLLKIHWPGPNSELLTCGSGVAAAIWILKIASADSNVLSLPPCR